MQTNLFAFTEATPTDGYPGFVSLNQQPDGAITLTVRSPGDGGRQIGALTLPAEALKGLTLALAGRDLDALTARFLTWPVPADVYPDGTPGQPGRTGTNLLSAPQAKEMLQHVLGG